MPRKVLNVIECAYRATLEEQDDTVVWMVHALKGAGATPDVLLRGNAVNYAVKGQDAAGLQFGERKQTHPPTIDEDVAKLIPKGVKVYCVEDDLAERGIEKSELTAGIELVAKAELPKLVGAYDQVWHW